MDTTFTPTALSGTAPAPQPFSLGRLGAIPVRNQIMLAMGAVLLAVVAWLSLSMGREPEWKALYAGMSDRDGGAVLAALTQMNVPYKFTDGGGAILVPANQVHDVRLRLASQGLPKGGTVGFELMENQKFGVTQFQERLNFQRGLEGELARSIMALSAVQAARVHLALPAQSAFMREQQKPSASVLLTLYGGRTLERAQVAGIVHLVASSVPEMNPKAVSIVDQSGTLLSQVGGELPNGMDAPQQQYVRQTEQSLAQRILSIVEPIVGAGNVRAQVNADIDFTQSESTAELYTPNQGNAPAAVRTQQLSETPQGGAAGAGLGGGVPGALANQPPNTAASPVNGPGSAPGIAGAAAAAAGGVKRDATTQYEVDKTVRVVRSATGSIKRLSAAVIVNHSVTTGPDGKPAVKALTAPQMEQINALVREAIGFSKERGDSVNVANAPFTTLTQPAVAELPLWRQPETIELARSTAPWVAMPLIAMIIIFGLVRPAMRAARAQPVARRLEATVQDAIPLDDAQAHGQAHKVSIDGGDPSVPLLPTAQAAAQQARNAQLDNIRLLARQNPATVANVVRNWVGQPA